MGTGTIFYLNVNEFIDNVTSNFDNKKKQEIFLNLALTQTADVL